MYLYALTTALLAFQGCTGNSSTDPRGVTQDSSQSSEEADTADTVTETAPPDTQDQDSGSAFDVCAPPSEADHLFPPYPPVPPDCLQDYWSCPLEPGYATLDPTTTCNITDGYDADGAMQEALWEAYDYARDYFGAYGPVYVYVLGPTSAESNLDIWHLRAERRAVVEACVSVEDQVQSFLADPYGIEERNAANTGEGSYFYISGNSSCNPLMELMLINPQLEGLHTIVLHEYNHVFQVAHSLTWDRESDFGLNSWIMEGQATYSSALFGEITGWGPSLADVMMSMKNHGTPVSDTSIDDFLAEEGTFDLADESYWSRGDSSAAVVYYQLGAWAWAYLVHELDGDYDVVLRDYIRDVPTLGKEASFERHFGTTTKAFFETFDTFVQGDEESWRAILDAPTH